jgi:hypothetical protein
MIAMTTSIILVAASLLSIVVWHEKRWRFISFVLFGVLFVDDFTGKSESDLQCRVTSLSLDQSLNSRAIKHSISLHSCLRSFNLL